MENNNLDQENNLLGDYYFTVSYKSQNYKKSQEYKNWNKIMIEKYGKNAKEIICPKDYTIIYTIHYNNDERITCPSCNSIIYNCIFCNKNLTRIPSDCCIRTSLRKKMKDKDKRKFDYIFTNFEVDNETKEYYTSLIIVSFIPLISAFSLIGNIVQLLLSGIIDEITCCKDFLIYIFFLAFLFIMGLIYGIIYYIIFTSFFILSIPFKLYPVKLYFGLLITMESICDNDE